MDHSESFFGIALRVTLSTQQTVSQNVTTAESSLVEAKVVSNPCESVVGSLMVDLSMVVSND